MVTGGGTAGDQNASLYVTNASLYVTTTDVEGLYGELGARPEVLEPISTAFHGMR